jgi:hypothetical protein
MKTLLLAVGVLLVLGACASLPPPESDSSALVVGYLVEDYPDGFYNKAPRTLRHGINIGVRNLTQGTRFTVKTSDGYFYFLSNGTDNYLLEGYELEVKESGEGTYMVRGKLDRRFGATPGKLVYLGNLTITQAQPEKTIEKLGGRETYWHFEASVDLQWKKQDLLEYLRGVDHESVWLEREIVQEEWKS